MLGAVSITLGGFVWYLVYGRSRTHRTGALGVLLGTESNEELSSAD